MPSKNLHAPYSVFISVILNDVERILAKFLLHKQTVQVPKLLDILFCLSFCVWQINVFIRWCQNTAKKFNRLHRLTNITDR